MLRNLDFLIIMKGTNLLTDFKNENDIISSLMAGKTVEHGREEGQIEAIMVHEGEDCECTKDRVFQQVIMIISGRHKHSSSPPRFLAGATGRTKIVI